MKNEFLKNILKHELLSRQKQSNKTKKSEAFLGKRKIFVRNWAKEISKKKFYFYKERQSKAALKLEFAFGFKLITTEQVQDFGENRLKRWS
jgi:hypothetical protein